jgi:hypothetical protein
MRPEALTPGQRIQCIAAILAQGFLRLRALDLAPRESQPGKADSPEIPLDVCGQTRVTGGRVSDREVRA